MQFKLASALLLLLASSDVLAAACDGAATNGCVQVKQEEDAASSTPSISTDSNVTAGSLSILELRNVADGAFTGCTGTRGAYTAVDVDIEQSTSGHHARAFYFKDSAGGAETINCTVGASVDTRMIYAEYAAANCDSVVDADAVDLSSGDPLTATDLVTATGNQVAISGLSTNTNVGIDPNGGETEQDEFGLRLQIQDEAVTTGNYSPSWNLGSAQAGIAMAIICAPPAATGLLLQMNQGSSNAPL
jgi:hypothetical protein